MTHLTPEREQEIRELAPEFGALQELLAEVDRLRDEMKQRLADSEASVRGKIADDFRHIGRRQDTLSWGEAHIIASHGLCSCQGGTKPCPRGGGSR